MSKGEREEINVVGERSSLSRLPWVPEVFLVRFPVLVMSLLCPVRKTSGAERNFFDSADPMTSQFKSIWTRKLVGS